VQVDVAFDGARLVNVIDHLGARTGEQFFVNWPALEMVGVEQDLRVSFVLKAGPLPTVLDQACAQANAIAQFDPIGWTVRDGVIHVSTLRDLRGRTLVRIYDARAILALPDAEPMEQEEAAMAMVYHVLGEPTEFIDQLHATAFNDGFLTIRCDTDHHRQLDAYIADLTRARAARDPEAATPNGVPPQGPRPGSDAP